jgi:hypothetical protein
MATLSDNPIEALSENDNKLEIKYELITLMAGTHSELNNPK